MRALYASLFSIGLFHASFAQWTPLATATLSNRSITSMNGDLYLVSFPNGVKKSVGGVGPWTDVNTGLPLNGSSYFVQSVGSDGAYLYAGTESGIYRSASGTDTWSSINGSLTASNQVYANKFFVSGSNLLAVFTGTILQGGGIWRSSTFGNSWLIGHSGMGSNAQVNHVTQVGGTLYASTSVGIYTSTDNAQNWNVLPSVNYATYSLAAIADRLVIVSTFGIRYSTDNGLSWIDATGDPGSPTDAELVAFDGALYALINGVGCLRSMDNGSTWTEWNTGFSEIDAQAQEEFFVQPERLLCTALFDVYALEGTDMGLSEALAPATIRVFPTVVDPGFTAQNNGPAGTIIIVDQAGRRIREVAIGANTSTWVGREGIPSGLYTLLFSTQRGGAERPAGRLFME